MLTFWFDQQALILLGCTGREGRRVLGSPQGACGGRRGPAGRGRGLGFHSAAPEVQIAKCGKEKELDETVPTGLQGPAPGAEGPSQGFTHYTAPFSWLLAKQIFRKCSGNVDNGARISAPFRFSVSGERGGMICRSRSSARIDRSRVQALTRQIDF